MQQNQSTRPKIDTLILIGNGFDIWQGLNTSYSQFEEYYHAHLDEILKDLKIKKRTLLDEAGHPIFDENGTPITYSDVELFFGNPFEPEKLPYSFWSTFEASLDKLDDQQINLFFGKDSQGLKGIKKSAINAQRILRKAFCDWIETIHIEEKETGYQFGDNCLFINFNYTDTLVKCFKVCEDNIYHIHGSASHRDSIIFGHATHPEYALAYMKELGGRLEGLFHVEEALYYLDKHVGDNYTKLCEFIALHEAMMDEVMFRMADDPYYHMSLEERMHLEMAAVRRRYWCEQQQRDEEEERKFFRKVKAEMKRRGVSISNEQKEKDQRQEKIQKCMDAPSWHISFYSDADRLRIEQVMKKAGCEKYELYDTIDDCISCFKLV